jgi:two-component system response regulator RegX3
MEFKLIYYLVTNKNRVITKTELFRNVWNDAITMDGTLNVHIRRLREKIETDPNNPEFILTDWGNGYVFKG